MPDSVDKVIRKTFGPKIYTGIILILVGGFGWWWINEYFMSKQSFAEEKDKFIEQIQIGDNTQQLQLLYLRRDMATKSVEEAEDKIDANPNSEKWKSRLEERKQTKKSIEYQIQVTNAELRKSQPAATPVTDSGDNR